MRNIYGLVFLFTLIVHLAGIYLGNDIVEKASKIVLVPILLLYFITETRTIPSALKKWIVMALFFSWVGDILLLFVAASAGYFLAGLCAFLLAHIFYILFFHTLRVAEAVRARAFLLVPAVVYYAVLMGILSPWLGDMKLPVRVYGVVICFMLMLASHTYYIKNRKAGLYLIAGAVLFVISDSVLAINKFYVPFQAAGSIIMLTYGMAQLLLVQGAIKYIRDK